MVAVATPDEFVVHGPLLRVAVPDDTSKYTDWLGTPLPAESLDVAVMVEVAVPFAVTLEDDAVTVDWAAVALPGPVTVTVRLTVKEPPENCSV